MPYSSAFIRYERVGNKVTPVRVHKAIQPDGSLKTMRVTEMGWPVSTPNFGPNLEIAYEVEGDGEQVPSDWISVKGFCPMNRFDLIDAGFLQLARLYDGFTNAPYLELDDAALAEHERFLGDTFMPMDNSCFIYSPPVKEVENAV